MNTKYLLLFPCLVVIPFEGRQGGFSGLKMAPKASFSITDLEIKSKDPCFKSSFITLILEVLLKKLNTLSSLS